jgi:hypothetical protein
MIRSLVKCVGKSKRAFRFNLFKLVACDIALVLIFILLSSLFITSVLFYADKYDLKERSENIYSQYGTEALANSEEIYSSWLNESTDTSKSILVFMGLCLISFLVIWGLFFSIFSFASAIIWRTIRRIKVSLLSFFLSFLLKNLIISYIFLFFSVLFAILLSNEGVHVLHISLFVIILLLLFVNFIFVSNVYYNCKLGRFKNLRKLSILSLKMLPTTMFLFVVLTLILVVLLSLISLLSLPIISHISNYVAAFIFTLVILLFHSWGRYFCYLFLAKSRGVKNG